MRRIRSTARLFLLGSLALATLSCGTSTPSRESSSGEPHQDAAVEDSGKRLSGEFNLISLEDSYRRDNPPAEATFRFDENGDFKRQDGLRFEEGSYLITAQNEMVLYIEKVNGELRSAARVEHYQIADQSENGFTLKEGPSRKLVLLKR
ncbi:MAG TPA: hypothetical protein VN937_08560 [Blastocatellia bacterium]|nr:hypothetical protein [Blastocatellia bacterium]